MDAVLLFFLVEAQLVGERLLVGLGLEVLVLAVGADDVGHDVAGLLALLVALLEDALAQREGRARLDGPATAAARTGLEAGRRASDREEVARSGGSR